MYFLIQINTNSIEEERGRVKRKTAPHVGLSSMRLSDRTLREVRAGPAPEPLLSRMWGLESCLRIQSGPTPGETMDDFLIDFEPIGRRGRVAGGQSLLDAARRLGVDLANLCGGTGRCGRCKVQVLAGRVSELTASEQEQLSPAELERGCRMACQTRPLDDCTLYVPPESLTAPQRTQVEGLEVAVDPNPDVIAYPLDLSAPTLADLKADGDRLIEALEQQHHVSCKTADLAVLRALSSRLRSSGWKLRATVRQGEIVAACSLRSRPLGLAVDLGTTKIAGYLVDLESGRTMASRGIMNPQIAYGEDVVARLSRAIESREESSRLQQLAAGGLNQLAMELCSEVGTEPEEIVEVVVAGNTAMHHLLLGLAVDQLAAAPYVPTISAPLDVKARDIALRLAAGAYVHMLPNIAGYVGSDHVAMMLATELQKAQGVVLALDIGTNTEVCLVSRGEMWSVSCASGPAFEGAHIHQGMRAAAGAIERLCITGGRVEYQTIGGTPPTGLCGSGIVDAVAHLYRAGVLNRRGRMDLKPGVRVREDQREFVLVPESAGSERPPILVTQQDVRQVQLAKGAIRAGIRVLVESRGLSEEEIDQVIIAGAFGTYIDVASAITIGMLPSLPLDRFHQVGNAAGKGATLALVSLDKRHEAHAIARQAGYIELAGYPDFMNIFVQAMYLGPVGKEEE
jgi:uncharacterized 2Fe-2S/4Fe-4S cluster protein (DUF4445 family)